MPKIFRFKNAFTINMLVAVFSIVGVLLIPKISFTLYPKQQSKELYISYSYPNASARVVEQEMTSVIEANMVLVQGVSEITSSSDNSSGSITVKFDEKVNIDHKRFEISNLLRNLQSKLPKGASYPEIHSRSIMASAGSELQRYTFNSALTNNELKKFIEDNIIKDLSEFDGVNSLDLSGLIRQRVVLRYDPKQLSNAGVELKDITSSLSSYDSNIELGMINDGMLQFPIAIKSDEVSLEELKDLIVKNVDGKIFYLKQLCEISKENEQVNQISRVNGLNTINFSIKSTKSANEIELAKKLDEYFKAHKASWLSKGISFMKIIDSSEKMDKEIYTTVLRVLASLILLLLLILLINRSWKYLFILFFGLVSNLLIANVFYYLLGVNINVYSLAGITIALGIVIDNSIIMTDHITKNFNTRVVRSIIAATLTTVAALLTVFLLDKRDISMLSDFAWVIVINLLISIFISALLIPSLVSVFNYSTDIKVIRFKSKRRILKFSNFYKKSLLFLLKKRKLAIALIILMFGLPFYLLPTKIGVTNQYGFDIKDKEENLWEKAYNKTIGSSFYQSDLKPYLDKYLGGSLYYFNTNKTSSYIMGEKQETVLSVNVDLPIGYSIEQLDHVVKQFENQLAQIEGINYYTSDLSGGSSTSPRASIRVYFHEKEFPMSPWITKSTMENMSILSGNADFSVYGVGKGFSNSLGRESVNSQIKILGFNYDELLEIAENSAKRLLENPRIDKVNVNSVSYYQKKNSYEFYADVDDRISVLNDIGYNDIKNSIAKVNILPTKFAMKSSSDLEFDFVPLLKKNFRFWDLENLAVSGQKGSQMRFADIAQLEKRQKDERILREDQQYTMELSYQFNGPSKLNDRVKDREVKHLQESMPLGYSIGNARGWYGYFSTGSATNNYFNLSLLIIVLTIMICAIFFESYKYAFMVVVMVPFSFIGIFLAFPLFKVGFTEGGYASFLLMGGLTVNAGIYILDAFKIQRNNKIGLDKYVSAINKKIRPIILTILSTVLSFIPFLLVNPDRFWQALAVGTIAGLVFSIFVLLFILPLLTVKLDKR